MQLPKSPGEQAGIWNGECVSSSSQGRVSLMHLKNGCPQHFAERGASIGTPKINFAFIPQVDSRCKIVPFLATLLPPSKRGTLIP